MKLINIIYANSFLKDKYIISDPGIQTLNQHVSGKIKISPDEFYFEGFPIGPLYLKDIPDLSTILVKFHHPSDDLIFEFPNKEQIKIEKASRMNYRSIVAYLNKLRFYFSDECIEKSLRFSVFGKNYDIEYAKGCFIEGIPNIVPVYIKLLVQTVIIQSNEMKFVFCENEKSNSVIKFLNNTFPQTTDFKICQAGPSYGELRLRATEKYEIRANYICTFHGPKGQQINLNLNFQSTFNDAKIMLVHSPQTDIYFIVKDKRIENLNSSIIPYLKDGYIFYDIEKQNPSYQMPQYPAPPPVMPVPSAASPVTPPPSDLTKSQSKAKPVNFEEKVEILFQFEKSIGKEIKPIKKQLKPTTTVNEMIEIIKKENDLDCEIEMSYKEEEDKVKIEPNETIKTIQQYIIQPNRQNIIYVGSPQKKPSTKAKSKKPKIKLNYDISNAENDKPSKKPLQVNGSEQELLKLREEIENYKSIIRDKTQELTRMQEEVNNQKIIISDNKKELSRLQDENENQKIEIKRLQKENQNQGIQKNKPQNKELQILDAETIENLEKIEEIGSGGGGRVFKVSRKEIYALKEMNMNNSDMNDFKHFIREYEIISMLQHPNIIKAIGIFLSNAKNAPSILLEYLPMNLSTAIKNKIFTNEQIVFCIYQIVEGMKFVHFRRIIHRDLKPTNILIASDGTIKICDFGISKLMTIEEQSMTLGIGTQKFMAPEIINEDDNYDEKVDVYSFGVVLFFILSGGNIPKIKTGDILKGKKAEIPSTFTNFSKEIINECWNFKSKDRPSFAEILEKMEKSNYNLLDLTETELKNVKSLIKLHKAKIQSLKE